MLNKFLKLLNAISKKVLLKSSFDNLKELKPNSKLAIFDLDNTLVDTGTELIKIGRYPGFFGYFSIYRRSKPLVNMVRLISHLKDRKVEIVFLSARSFAYYWVTKEWIKNNLSIKNSNIVLVDSAMSKVKILESFSKYHIFYYDDLTYGHENRIIFKYDSVVSEVKKLNVNYFDEIFIHNVQASEKHIVNHLKLFYEP